MVINEYCKDCQLRRNMIKYPATASADEIAAYQRGVRSIIAHSDGLSTPQTSEKMIALRRELFGPTKDFTTIKQHFNSLILNLLPHMRQQVAEADDALRMAVQYAMVGNYIDFGVLAEVDDGECHRRHLLRGHGGNPESRCPDIERSGKLRGAQRLRPEHLLPFLMQVRSVHTAFQRPSVHRRHDTGSPPRQNSPGERVVVLIYLKEGPIKTGTPVLPPG